MQETVTADDNDHALLPLGRSAPSSRGEERENPVSPFTSNSPKIKMVA